MGNTQFCTDVILLDGLKLHQYSGGVCSYEKMRRQLESSRRREYEAQEKAVKDLMAKGAGREAAEKVLSPSRRGPLKCPLFFTFTVLSVCFYSVCSVCGKALAKSKAKGRAREDDEEAPVLLDKPREYLVKFKFDDPESTMPGVSVQGAAFG